MRFIHPAILKQRDANQPSWWGAFLLFFCVAYGVTVLGLLAQLAGFSPGKIFWLSIHMLLCLGTATYLLVRYRAGMNSFSGYCKPKLLASVGMTILLALPMTLYYGPQALLVLNWQKDQLQGIEDFSELAESPDLPPFKRAMARESVDVMRSGIQKLHEIVWKPLAYGSDRSGVFCNILLSFVAPLVETLLFFVVGLNLLYRRLPILWALFFSAAMFTVAHVPAFGFGDHLLPLLWLGVFSAAARLYTGTWIAAFAVHVVINALIYLPKIFIAIAAIRLGII